MGLIHHLDEAGNIGIIYTMKTSTMRIGGEAVKAKKPFALRMLFAKVAKFVDDLIVKYYYKGERLRSEIVAKLRVVDDGTLGVLCMSIKI